MVISIVDGSKSGSEKKQSVVYRVSDTRKCTLGVSAGFNSANVTLRDYIFDREGTRVDIRVGDDEAKIGGGSDFGTVICNHWGSTLAVHKDAGNLLIATKHVTTAHGIALFVSHLYASQKGFSIAVVKVWYDAAKATFMFHITSPSVHSSFEETLLAMKKTYSDVLDSPYSTGQQSIITHLIKNTGGPFYGHLNGSFTTDSVINFFIVHMNNKLPHT
ncbi:hypothetical protein CR513_45149, partial [Mucuna pruriens]